MPGKVGQTKTLKNGAVGKWMKKGGKVVFRIVKGANAAGIRRARAGRHSIKDRITGEIKGKKITLAQAQKAFRRFYSGSGSPGGLKAYRRGPNKGKPRYKSVRGKRSSRTYDLRHSLPEGRIITDSRYLRRTGPRLFDYPGVDTGVPAKLLSKKQIDALLKGRTRVGKPARRRSKRRRTRSRAA